MGVDSPVAGVAGAVRIQRLGGVALSAAEAHGKRLDVNGRGRVVREAESLSTTGLDLNALYDAHVEGAKVQKSATKALHMVMQFPADLVDGDDGELMLFHARTFAEELFGTSAIFADRVDRDEKSRHVVDLFIAPKYEKQTKRKTQTAISTSRDLKALASRYKRPPSLRGQGQALQDAWYEYLRDRLCLEVKRGEPKKRPGSDWKSAEALEADRLKQKIEELGREKEALREELASVRSAKSLLEHERMFLRAERQRLKETRADLVKLIEKTKSASDQLRNMVPSDLIAALTVLLGACITAFQKLNWMDEKARFTSQFDAEDEAKRALVFASKAITNLSSVQQASEVEEDDGYYYDPGPSGP